MATDKNRTLVMVLIGIVLILLAIIAYAFVIGPRLSGYATNKQIEGYQIAVLDIVQAASKCQTVPIPVSENQTINLLAAECLPQEILQQLSGVPTQPAA